jgi:nitroreductase
MNETVKSLLGRRSVRAYKSDPVPEEILDEILQAGIYAPSGGNQQSATVIATQNPELIRKLEIMNAKYIPSKKTDIRPYYNAPVLISIIARSDSPGAVEDGTLIASNIMNAAYSYGLGSCWVHRAREVFDSEEGKALLTEWGIEGDYIGICQIVIGYPAGDFPPAPKRKENYIYKV